MVSRLGYSRCIRMSSMFNLKPVQQAQSFYFYIKGKSK